MLRDPRIAAGRLCFFAAKANKMDVKNTFVLRSRIISKIREILDAKGGIEVEDYLRKMPALLLLCRLFLFIRLNYLD